MERIKLSNLKNVHMPYFFDELSKAPKNLEQRQENQFYTYLLRNFDENISEEAGRFILEVLCHCFSESEKRIATFVKKGHHLDLPYKDDRFEDLIFDILYIMADKCPESYDDAYQISEPFQHMLTKNPQKALIILSVLTNGLNYIESPWCVYDLLFKFWKKLYRESPDNFISLVTYLCRYDQGFLQGRGRICYNRIIHLLNTESEENVEILRILYTAACKIYDCDPSITDPDPSKPQSTKKYVQSEVLIRHIQIEILQSPIISYLLRQPLNPEDENIIPLLKILIKLGKKSERASFIVIKLSEAENISTFLVKNLSMWLPEPFYNHNNTVLLLLIVIRNEGMRKKLTLSNEILTFITNTLQEDPSYLSPLLKIMNRLIVNETFVNTLYENEILTAFVNKAKTLEDPQQEKCMILIFSIFAKVDYKDDPPNFTSICNYLISVLKKRNENLNNAAAVILRYSRLDSCKNHFRKKKVINIFSKIDGDATFMKIFKKLVKELQ